MITDVVDEWWKVHDRAPHLLLPGGVFNKYGPTCEDIDTPTDHRMLWWVRDQLLGVKRTPAVGEIFDLLNSYLGATCQHHWSDHQDHRQCLWCNDVQWTPEGES